MALFTCPECGNQVSDKADMCPACGFPTEDIIAKANELKRQKVRKRNLKLGLLGGIIAVAIIIFVAIIYIISRPDTSGYFNGIKWNASFETLKQKMAADDIYIDQEDMEISQTVEDFDGMKGVVGWIDYCFEDEKLYKISIMLYIDEDETDMTYMELNKKLSDGFTEVYGESKKSGSSTRFWTTENSTISIWFYKSMFTLTYTDINHEEK